MEFLGRFPDRIKNPVTYAENFKKRYKIEYFSESDIQYAVNEITRAAGEFFGAEERPERVRNELFEEKPEVA